VQVVPIDKLKQWKDNPRKNDNAAKELSKLIAAHGQRTPVVAWRKNGVIYKGNMTHKAMRLLGMKEIAVLWADFPSEYAAIAYGIADNKSSEFAEWDNDILLSMLRTQPLSQTGFTKTEFNNMHMLPDLDKVDKVNAAHSGLKDKIIVMVLDAAKKAEVKEMLENWLETYKIEGVEVK